MEKTNFAKAAIFLAFFSILGKVIGAIYRIPLTNILGSEGMGLYQLVFSFFVVALSLASTGISLTVTKMVAEQPSNSKVVFGLALKSCIVISLILTLVFVLLSRVISSLQGNINAGRVYLSMASTIVVVSVLAVLRGYLKGKEDIKSFAVSEIIEQILKLGFGLGLALFFIRYGVVYAVMGSFFGIGIAALAALVYAAIKKVKIDRLKTLQKNKIPNRQNSSMIEQSFSEVSHFNPTVQQADTSINHCSFVGEKKFRLKQKFDKKIFFKYAILSSLCAIIVPITQFVDSVLVVNLLIKKGFSVASATQQFGLSAGVVSSIVNLPLALIIALETIVLPSLSRTNKSQKTTQRKSKEAVFLAGLVALPCAILIMVFASQIVAVLYSKGLSSAELALATNMLKVGSMGLFFSALAQISAVVFQGEGKFHLPLYSLIFGAVCKFFAMFLLIPYFGIIGAEIAIVFYYFVVCVINLSILKKGQLIGGDKRTYIAIILAFFVGVVGLLCNLLLGDRFGSFLHILISGLVLAVSTSVMILLYFFVVKKSKKSTVK